jgi:thiamine pyrophosphate-dependent acetolactate synthase large subunit-like protein
VTQLITALPAAVRAHLPLVVFAGEAPLKSGWYNQELDQAPIITATGAAYHRLHMPERMPVAMRDAFLQARRERRPVVIGIRSICRTGRGTDRRSAQALARAVAATSPMPPHPDDVRQAAQAGRRRRARRRARRPGRGRSRSGAACRALAARTGGLLATTLPARGLFPRRSFLHRHLGSYTPEVGIEYLKEADLVIAVGCSLATTRAAAASSGRRRRMLQIDIDPVAVSQGQEVAKHHLRADARLGVEALTAALAARGQSGKWRSDAMAARIRDSKPDSQVFEIEPGLLDPRDVVAALEKALPREWEMVNSGGHCSWFFAQMPSRPQEKFLTIREFGAIGNGISFAMGVAAARPDRTVVLFDGDGSLMMHVQELETIRRHGLNLLVVVMNDGAYGSEVHKLRSEGLPEVGSVFGYCDFAASRADSGLREGRSRAWTTCRRRVRSSPRAAAPRSGTSTSRTRSCLRPSAAPIRTRPDRKRYSTRQIACAAMPSPRPANPSFSVVVAFTFTALARHGEVGGDVRHHASDVRRHARRLGDDGGVDVHHAKAGSPQELGARGEAARGCRCPCSARPNPGSACRCRPAPRRPATRRRSRAGSTSASEWPSRPLSWAISTPPITSLRPATSWWTSKPWPILTSAPGRSAEDHFRDGDVLGERDLDVRVLRLSTRPRRVVADRFHRPRFIGGRGFLLQARRQRSRWNIWGVCARHSARRGMVAATRRFSSADFTYP